MLKHSNLSLTYLSKNIKTYWTKFKHLPIYIAAIPQHAFVLQGKGGCSYRTREQVIKQLFHWCWKQKWDKDISNHSLPSNVGWRHISCVSHISERSGRCFPRCLFHPGQESSATTESERLFLWGRGHLVTGRDGQLLGDKLAVQQTIRFDGKILWGGEKWGLLKILTADFFIWFIHFLQGVQEFLWC